MTQRHSLGELIGQGDLIIDGDSYRMRRHPALRPWLREDFYLRCPGVDMADLPRSLLLIPYILTIAPVVWLYGLHFRVTGLDPVFADSLAAIKQALAAHHSGVRWTGAFQVGDTEPLPAPSQAGSAITLFSGGVDSWTTLLRHLDEHPALVTVRGADIGLDNESAWQRAWAATQATADHLGLAAYAVETTAKRMMDIPALERGYGWSWWLDVQFGLTFAGMLALPAWLHGAGRGYMAASMGPGQQHFCVSRPEIDNAVTWTGYACHHDGEEWHRFAKIAYMVKQQRVPAMHIDLRVCYQPNAAGGNCGQCEKCCRTRLGLYVAGADPEQYGFSNDHQQLQKHLVAGIDGGGWLLPPIVGELYVAMQQQLRASVALTASEIPVLTWLRHAQIEAAVQHTLRRQRRRAGYRRLLQSIPGALPLARRLWGRQRRKA